MGGPSENTGLEESAVNNQLPAALEQIEQAQLTLGPFEFVLFPHERPRHPAAFGGQSIPGAGEGLLLNEELLPCSLPFLRGHDWWCFHFVHIFYLCLCSTPCHFSFLA